MKNALLKQVQDLHETFSNNDFEKTLSMASDEIVVEAFALGSTFRGKDAFGQFMRGFKLAFPDMKIRHDRVHVDDNEVTVEFTATGTHTGDLHTPAGIVGPTGKKVSLHVCECQTWENGKLKSIRNYQDSGSLARQLGLM